jgi:hypothetical protein
MPSGKLKACSLCGSLEIQPIPLSEGGVPGASEVAGAYWCRKCKRKVVPAVFKNIKEYERFLKGIHR